MTREAATAAETEFHERMHAAHMYGLWELASQMTRHPEPQAIPYMWKASRCSRRWCARPARRCRSARSGGRSSSSIPDCDGRWATTNTMIAAVQILLPGEVARAHRHTPTAIRFIMEGAGAYTVGRRRARPHGAGRPHPDAELGVARPR